MNIKAWVLFTISLLLFTCFSDQAIAGGNLSTLLGPSEKLIKAPGFERLTISKGTQGTTGLMIKPGDNDQRSDTIVDDTLVQRWVLGNPDPGGVPPAGWYDIIGNDVFDTFQVNIIWSGEDIYLEIFTNFPETGYRDGTPIGYPHGGFWQVADLAVDLDRDGSWDIGVALIDHGPLPQDPSYPNPPGYGLPANYFTKGNIYAASAWFSSSDIHYYHSGRGGRYDMNYPKVPPVWMRLGQKIGEAEITWNDLGDTDPTYRIDVVLKGVNTSGEWDNFGFLWGTANCANDVIVRAVPIIIYIAPDGFCNGRTPCYSRIQDGIDWPNGLLTLKIQEGMYDEDIVLDEKKKITLEGGWDSTFTSLSGSSTVKSLIVYGDGTVVFDGFVVMSPLNN